MIITEVINKISTSFLEQIYIRPFAAKNQDREINGHNSLALICHPRGGSNWLGEILLNIQRTVLFDEPLWRGFYRSINYVPPASEGKIKKLSKLDFYLDQPIPKEVNWMEAKEIIELILKGCLLNQDIYDKNNIKSLKEGKLFITKFCYGHLLLPWLHNSFNIKSIILHRHPCAVVGSQLKHVGFKKILQNPSGKIPDFRFNEIYKSHNRIWESIRTKEEYLAAIWSIKTKYVLENPIRSSQSTTLYYENLLVDFENQLEHIQCFLSAKFPESISQLKNRPSSSSLRFEVLEEKQQLQKWNTQLSGIQVKNILNIVDKFGIEIYDNSLMPHITSKK